MILNNGLSFECFWHMFPELNDIPQMVQGIPTPLKVSQRDVIPLCYLFSLPFQLSSFDHRSQRPALIIKTNNND